MRSSLRAVILSSLAVAAAVPCTLNAQSGTLGRYLATLPYQTIDASERADLIAMRQEEKFARDVYRVLGNHWGLQSMLNIAQAEQSHMDLVKVVIDKYRIPDPITSDAVGVFRDAVYRQMFVDFVVVGAISRNHALLIGALVEDLDIRDLQAAIRNTDNRDFGTVLQNLIQGSRNHMRSFYGQLAKVGILYPGILLSWTDIQQIVTSPRESGPVDENGNKL